jgi:hypothetical protein
MFKCRARSGFRLTVGKYPTDNVRVLFPAPISTFFYVSSIFRGDIIPRVVSNAGGTCQKLKLMVNSFFYPQLKMK